ncbi:MAG: hypothetical protein HY659_12800 [Rhizobiales bacterium]|nr:hypothetical protein [Hyphomicrobiales bacterium]
MLRYFARSILIVAPSLFIVSFALAHDSWISRGAFKSPISNEWCCGEGDCFVIPSDSVQMNGVGYELFGVEMVPFTEAMPSPDGAFWRCKRPDGSRRCFFAPPPGS